MKYPCKDFGNRRKDWPKCQPCPDEICENCSILTLEKMFGGKNVQILTSKGKKLDLSTAISQRENTYKKPT